MRGLRLEWKKETSLLAWTIRRSNPPAKVRLFLKAANGASCRPCVKVGDRVRVGQVIGESRGGSEPAFVHASLSGEVAAIQPFFHPYGGEAEAVEIQTDSKDEKMPGVGEERKNWETLEPEELKKIFRESGFAFAPRRKKIKTILLNGCESEPYVTSAHALMMSHPVEILKGAEIFRKAFSAERILFVTEDNKLEAAELLKSKIYFLKWKHVESEILPSLYPQDHSAVLARQYADSDGASPEILDVAAAYAVWEAVARQKPVYERAVTVGGECVIEPKNFWVRNGTALEVLFKNAKGLLRPPEKVLLGGPMRGIPQKFLDAPILQETPALLALPREVVATGEEAPCIRCGKCIDACPSELSPVMITLAAEQGFWDLARDYEGGKCIECGNCGYVCPSRRPMLELIRKQKL